MVNSEHIFSCRIYYEDTDAGGIVYYSNYFKFTERARTEMLRDLDIYQAEVKEKYGLLFVVKSLTAEFYSSARLDDLLEIKTFFLKVGKVRFSLGQEIYKEKNLLARTQVKLGVIDIKGRPKGLPSDLFNKFEIYKN